MKNIKAKRKRKTSITYENAYLELEDFLIEEYDIYLSEQNEAYNTNANELAIAIASGKVEIKEIDSGKTAKLALVKKTRESIIPNSEPSEIEKSTDGMTRKVFVQNLSNGDILEYKNSIITAKKASAFSPKATDADKVKINTEEMKIDYAIALTGKSKEYADKIPDKDYSIFMIISDILFL